MTEAELQQQNEILSIDRKGQVKGISTTIVNGPASTFHFRRKTDRNSPRTGQSSVSRKLEANTARSFKKNSVGHSTNEPGTFLYLGNNGDANALQSDIYSARSSSRKPFKTSRKGMVETPSVMRDIAGTPMVRRAAPRDKATFDNNSYTMIKQTLNKSPKMAKYIKEVYDANKYHSQMILNRSKTTNRHRSPNKQNLQGPNIMVSDDSDVRD